MHLDFLIISGIFSKNDLDIDILPPPSPFPDLAGKGKKKKRNDRLAKLEEENKKLGRDLEWKRKLEEFEKEKKHEKRIKDSKKKAFNFLHKAGFLRTEEEKRKYKAEKEKEQKAKELELERLEKEKRKEELEYKKKQRIEKRNYEKELKRVERGERRKLSEEIRGRELEKTRNEKENRRREQENRKRARIRAQRIKEYEKKVYDFFNDISLGKNKEVSLEKEKKIDEIKEGLDTKVPEKKELKRKKKEDIKKKNKELLQKRVNLVKEKTFHFLHHTGFAKTEEDKERIGKQRREHQKFLEEAKKLKEEQKKKIKEKKVDKVKKGDIDEVKPKVSLFDFFNKIKLVKTEEEKSKINEQKVKERLRTLKEAGEELERKRALEKNKKEKELELKKIEKEKKKSEENEKLLDSVEKKDIENISKKPKTSSIFDIFKKKEEKLFENELKELHEVLIKHDKEEPKKEEVKVIEKVKKPEEVAAVKEEKEQIKEALTFNKLDTGKKGIFSFFGKHKSQKSGKENNLIKEARKLDEKFKNSMESIERKEKDKVNSFGLEYKNYDVDLEIDYDKKSKKKGKTILSSVLGEKEEKIFHEELKDLHEVLIKHDKEEPKKEEVKVVEKVKEGILESKDEIWKAIQGIKKTEDENDIIKNIFKMEGKIKEENVEMPEIMPKVETKLDNLYKIEKTIHKARLALMDLKVKEAKKIYNEVMNIYNNLDDKKKIKVYDEIKDLYYERKSAERIAKV